MAPSNCWPGRTEAPAGKTSLTGIPLGKRWGITDIQTDRWGRGRRQPHLDLALSHDSVCVLAVLLGDLHFVVTLFVAQNPQGLGAFQLNLKLLQPQEGRKVLR